MPPKKRVKTDAGAVERIKNASSTEDSLASLSLSPSNASLGSLPFDVKHHICRDFGLTPIDLLHLSHVNKAWYECATEDDLFTEWYNVLLYSTY